jgi:IMP dehydrogenase
MAKPPIDGDFGLALTFDDVLVVPAASEVMPGQVDVSTRLTRSIELNIPVISSAMDTVTESRLAIAMAQEGGLGVLHRNLAPDEQARHVSTVKKYESGIVLNPVTIHPAAKLQEALKLMADHSISGIPVVEASRKGDGKGRLVGILTNRDVRFATNPNQPVSELMTKDKLITVKRDVSREEAKRLLHQHRIEKLIVVDDDFHCIGLITVKDIEKAQKHPDACKDPEGRLRVAAATTVGEEGQERTERLIAAGCDLIVVDTAHGHARAVIDAVARIKKLSNSVQVMAGNVATAEATRALIDAGADAAPGGIDPRSDESRGGVDGVEVCRPTSALDH